MTGLYMGYRLGTAGSENPAQILLTVFHMAQLVLIVPFQDQVYAPFQEYPAVPSCFHHLRAYLLLAPVAQTIFSDTTCRPGRSLLSMPPKEMNVLCSPNWNISLGSKFSGAKMPGFLASGGKEFNLGPEMRLDSSELLCNKVLLKYKGDRESF